MKKLICVMLMCYSVNVLAENVININNNTNINVISNIAESDINDMKLKFKNEVKQANLKDVDFLNYQNIILEELTRTNIINNQTLSDKLTEDQYLIVVDRNVKSQNAFLVFWNHDNQKVELLGATAISTGSTKKGHFITPIGLFENTLDNPSYRALGTKNENGIRGIGIKDSRVFDFGWQDSNAGWGTHSPAKIRFQLHGTDPDYLESRLGTPDSKGCVRVHTSMNQFLDKYGILDYWYEKSFQEKHNVWVLKKDRIKIKGAGKFLLVIDTTNNNIN